MKLNFIPLDYQEPILPLLKENTHFGVFSFPGSGKTVMSLDMIYHHRQATLVIVPLEILYTTWQSEPQKWGFSSGLKSVILHGKDKNANFHKKAGIYFINPEGMKWLLQKVKDTRRFPWENLVVDESVKFKNPKGVRFKSLCKLLKSFKRRYILSGNPIPNSYLDIWCQVFILDLGKRLDTSWYRFRNKYFYPTDYKRFNWEMKPGAKEDIIAAIADITYFLEVDDDRVPKVQTIDIPVILPPDAMKKYKQMENDLFAQLDEGINVLAPNASVSMMKCWQIAQGFLYETTEDGERITHYVHNELAVQAELHVESLQGQPCIIAYHFKEDLERLKKSFPNARVAQAGISPAEIQAIEKDWNDGNITILIAYISKLSHGLNMQQGPGNHILYYCGTFNYDIYDQLIYRLRRQGAGYRNVVVHRLIAQNTMHQALYASIEKKGTRAQDFLLALKEYRESNQSI